MRYRLSVVALTLALTFASACASSTALTRTVTIETAAVAGVHDIVAAERAAFTAGAYDKATHRRNLQHLRTVVRAESAINTALLSWTQADSETMPEQVRIAASALSAILSDLQPEFDPASPVGRLVSTIVRTLQAFTPGGGGTTLGVVPQ